MFHRRVRLSESPLFQKVDNVLVTMAMSGADHLSSGDLTARLLLSHKMLHLALLTARLTDIIYFFTCRDFKSILIRINALILNLVLCVTANRKLLKAYPSLKSVSDVP